MNNSGGWIKLHRSLTQHWVFSDPLLLKIWIDVLFMANHKCGKIVIKGKVINIKVGQFWTSIRKLADRWNINHKTVKKYLDMLQSEGMIFIDSDRNMGTLITICKYSDYQGFSDDDGNTKGNTKGNTVGTRNGHEQECKEYIKNEKEKGDSSGGYDV